MYGLFLGFRVSGDFSQARQVMRRFRFEGRAQDSTLWISDALSFRGLGIRGSGFRVSGLGFKGLIHLEEEAHAVGLGFMV
jgi:hypothetical protein